MLKFGFRTDIGKVRRDNEDALLVLPRANLFVVADGVGGANSGEVASRKAVHSIETFFKANPIGAADNLEGKYRNNWFRSYFLRCFRKVNNEILSMAHHKPQLSGMATTAVSAYMDGGKLYITNVGDSRAYIVRDGEIMQLTEDHTYINKLIHAGTLSLAEAAMHPNKNVITRALGAEGAVEPDFYDFDIVPKDRVLLCTDGLHGELSDEEILAIVNTEDDMDDLCMKLVNAANGRGGRDNTTVICIEI
ncbi:MAG: Stp1/IreP family PP2C-type Ser/Thr phosphatase [Clostridiales Family XIII bacterium]|jgi:protein phosphatase|nr:Stp1/IreP family PP2C-type Ser/Thr phosphatase [Clostridiales Family XIII bacterium]